MLADKFDDDMEHKCYSAGAVYLFQRHGTSWDFHSYIKAPNAGSTDYFGWSVALSADTLVVGAYNEDSCSKGVTATAATDDGCRSAGAVYVYTRKGDAWSFESYLKAQNAGRNDNFGHSIALDAASGTLAVGARYDDSCATGVSSSAATDQGCSSSGAVHIFERSGKTWRFESYVKSGSTSESDSFGYALALTPTTLAVGSYYEDSCSAGVSATAASDNGCSNSGAVHVFARKGGRQFEFDKFIKAPNAGATDYFGWSVALQGDTLAVGAYGEDGCATGVSKSAAADNACQSAGAVYLYHRGHGDWQFYRYVKAPNAGNNDNYGYSLALTDRTLAVGARNEDSCATGVSVTAAADNSCSSSGAVYLHQLPFVHFGSAGGVVGPRGSGRGGTVGGGSGGGIAIAGLVLILIISAYCARIALKRAQLCKNVGGVSERCAIHTRDVILGTHLQQISPSAEDRDDIATLPPASSSFERVVSRTHREPSSSEML